MLSQRQVFDPGYLTGLLRESRRATRALLFDLCDELAGPYRRAAGEWHLPIDLFRLAGRALAPEDFSRARVAGWIEELNDLVFFLDLRQELMRERDRPEFARQCFEHCRTAFYENRYLDDLFPKGRPEARGLPKRLTALCARLARQVVQEALFMDQEGTQAWLAGGPRKAKAPAWSLRCDLGEDPERAELPGVLSVGPEAAEVALPVRGSRRVGPRRWEIRPPTLYLRSGGVRLPIFETRPELGWRWEPQPPRYIISPGPGWPAGLALGPTLEYGPDLIPRRVVPSSADLAGRVGKAVAAIQAAWPEGAALLGLLTERVVPLKARGVVSFSYRHRPGLSFINTFDRDQLDLIDDLIHENSHHHLNLLLRKFDMRRGDRNLEIFYSPWRRSLRPLHGILHATFTFTVGATLFERLATWAGRPGGASRLRAAGLAGRDVERARFRCLEEIASVDYSIQDLRRAAEDWRWLSPAGVALVKALAGQIATVKRRSAAFRSAVRRSSFAAALSRHEKELAEARRQYGKARP